jgi:hypothetical protein
MRVLTVVVVLFLFVGSGVAQEKNDPLAALRGLKPWEVPYVPLTVSDTLGAVDTLWLELAKGAKAGQWVLNFHVFNDESLFAMSFTLRHDSLMTADSASLTGTRIDFFQTKLLNKKPPVPNTTTIGLFSALAPGAQPLAPGKGLVLKMFFSAPPERPLTIRSVAPIPMPPNLELVTPAGTAIHPAIIRVGDEPPRKDAPPPKKKDARDKSGKKSGN